MADVQTMTREEAAEQTTAEVPSGSTSAASDSRPSVDLTDAPQPFIDWELVWPGRVAWVGERGEEIRGRLARGVSEEGIRPMMVGIPSGVRIRVQPATRAGAVFEDTMPWEAGLMPGTSILFDEDTYRFWYFCAPGMLYAQSDDGVHWIRPLIDFVPYGTHGETNIMPHMENIGDRRIAPHEGCILKDPYHSPEELYRAVFTGAITDAEIEELETEFPEPERATSRRRRRKALYAATSPDGLSWVMRDRPIMLFPTDSQCVVYYDEDLARYVGYFQQREMGRHCIVRAETEDFYCWPQPVPVLAPGPEWDPYVDFSTNAFARYPGNPEIKLMFPTIHDRSRDTTEIRMAVSRDGVLWHWVPGGAVLQGGPAGAFDAGCVFSNVGFVRATDGRFAMLYTGYDRPYTFPRIDAYAGGIGCAWWPEDRLAAIEAPERGEFTTIPMRMRRKQLMLNMQVDHVGELRVEIRDRLFRPVPGRTFAESDSLIGNQTWVAATWGGDSDLSLLKDHIVYIRFRMRSAKIYAIKGQ